MMTLTRTKGSDAIYNLIYKRTIILVVNTNKIENETD